MKDPNRHVRSRAANAFITVGDERAVIPLINALKDSKSKVRARSAEALGVIGDTCAIEPLEIALKIAKDNYKTNVSQSATEAIAKLNKIKNNKVIELQTQAINQANNG